MLENYGSRKIIKRLRSMIREEKELSLRDSKIKKLRLLKIISIEADFPKPHLKVWLPLWPLDVSPVWSISFLPRYLMYNLYLLSLHISGLVPLLQKKHQVQLRGHIPWLEKRTWLFLGILQLPTQYCAQVRIKDNIEDYRKLFPQTLFPVDTMRIVKHFLI